MKMMRSPSGAVSRSGSAQGFIAGCSMQPIRAPRAGRLLQPSTVCAAYKKSSYYAYSEDLDTLDTVDDLNLGEFGTYAEPLYARPQQYSQGAYQSRYNQRARVNLPYSSMDYDYEQENTRDDAWDRPHEPRYINGKRVLCNKEITVPVVRVIAGDGGKIMKGVMKIEEAWNLARSSGVDLLLLNPDATPPLCRLCDWSKYKYELEKDQKMKSSKAASVETKEVRLRPGTDVGDLATKVKSAQKFLSKGNKVKLVMKFEGRELQFKEQGKQVMLKFIEDLNAFAKVDGNISFKTGTYTAILVPTGKAAKEGGSGSPVAEQAPVATQPAAEPVSAPLAGLPLPPSPAPPQRLPMPPAPPAPPAPGQVPVQPVAAPAAQPPLPPPPMQRPMQRPMTPGARPVAPAPLPMPPRHIASPSPGPALRPPMQGPPAPLPMPVRPMGMPPPAPVRQPVPAASN